MNAEQRIVAWVIDYPEDIDDPNLSQSLFAGKYSKAAIKALKALKGNLKENEYIDLSELKDMMLAYFKTSRSSSSSEERAADEIADFFFQIENPADKHTSKEGFRRAVINLELQKAGGKLYQEISKQGADVIKNGLLDLPPILEKVAQIQAVQSKFETDNAGANLLCFEEMEERTITWHVPGVYALGMIHSLGGVQGHGKSLHLIDLAARTSTGAAWPITGESIPKGDVLYITDEDSRDKIIKPRLRLAGADMSRIFIPDFNVTDLILPDDMPKIEAWIRSLRDPKLVPLDPLADYSLGSLNPTEAAVKIIKPLKALAERTGVCIIYSVHFNKKVDLDSIHRVAHSYVLTSKPRLTWLIIKQDPDDDLNPHRLFCCGKTAFKPIPNMMFTIKGDEFDTPYVDDWRIVKTQTSEALATGDRRRDLKVEDAEEFLLNALEEQEMFIDDLIKIGEKEGINYRAIYRAAKNLPIKDDYKGKRKIWKMDLGK